MLLEDLSTVIPIEIMMASPNFDLAVQNAAESAVKRFGALPGGYHSRSQLFEKVDALHVDFIRLESRLLSQGNVHVYRFNAYTRKD